MPIPPTVGMSDLFGEPTLPAGFRYIADVLSPAEEKDLAKLISDKWFDNYIKGKSIAASDRNWLLSWKIVARMNLDAKNKVLSTIAVIWET